MFLTHSRGLFTAFAGLLFAFPAGGFTRGSVRRRQETLRRWDDVLPVEILPGCTARGGGRDGTRAPLRCTGGGRSCRCGPAAPCRRFLAHRFQYPPAGLLEPLLKRPAARVRALGPDRARLRRPLRCWRLLCWPLLRRPDGPLRRCFAYLARSRIRVARLPRRTRTGFSRPALLLLTATQLPEQRPQHEEQYEQQGHERVKAHCSSSSSCVARAIWPRILVSDSMFCRL